LKELDDGSGADYVIDRILYNEKPFDKDGIPASSMLYFTNLDYHVTPNTLFYGYSEIEPIAHLSESNRIIDEVVLKEINRSLWAGNLIIYGETRDRAVMQDLVNKLDPAKPIGTNKTTKVESVQIQHELNNLVAERNENDKRILRALRVPSFLLGFEDVTNRATSSAVLHAWNVSELKSQRTWVNSILGPQWYDSLLMKFVGGEEAFNNLEYRFCHNFEEIIFDEFSDKADSVIKLFQAKIIPLEKALEILGFKDVLEEAQKLQDEMKAQQDEQNKMKMEVLKKGPMQKPETPEDKMMNAKLKAIEKIGDVLERAK